MSGRTSEVAPVPGRVVRRYAAAPRSARRPAPRRLLAPLDNTIVRQLVGAFWEVHTGVVPHLGIPTSDEIAVTVEAHEDMLTALEDGDATVYQEAVLAHYRPLKSAIEQALADRPHRAREA